MARRNRFDGAEQRIRSLAYAGLGSVELRVSVLAELARACPAEGAFFPTADPATLLYTSAVRAGMPGGLTAAFLDNEFHAPDVNKFRSLAAASTTMATLDRATRGNWPASARFREIMGPAGLGDELRAVFQTGTTTWGYACLHRAPGAPFDDGEISFIQGVATPLRGRTSGSEAASPLFGSSSRRISSTPSMSPSRPSRSAGGSDSGPPTRTCSTGSTSSPCPAPAALRTYSSGGGNHSGRRAPLRGRPEQARAQNG